MLEEAIMPIFHTRLTPDSAEQYTRSGHGGGETFYQIFGPNPKTGKDEYKETVKGPGDVAARANKRVKELTAAAAAAQLGCEVGAIANSLVFDCDGEPLLVMASGAHRVDTTLLAGALGATQIRKASPQLVRSATGQVIGGVAPTGHPGRLRTVVD